MMLLRVIKYKVAHFIIKKYISILGFSFGLYKKNDRNQRIVVSMTTFPKRIHSLDLCIKSILHQTVKPDVFVIYLGCDCSLEDVTYLKNKYEKYGVTIKYDLKNNYMSHKKYLYSLKEYCNDLIITVDDDLVYFPNMISSLLRINKKYPNCICARRVHLITWDDDKISKYADWNFEYEKCTKPSHSLFATTGAGTLFPPNVLPDFAFDFKLIKKYALYADDIWIKCMCLLNGVKIVWTKSSLQMPAVIDDTQESALFKNNVEEGNNDIFINKIFEDFHISKINFKEK